MKIISIYIDMRGSSKLSLSKKKDEYTKLYRKFNKYEGSELESIGYHTKSFIGDAVLLVFKANDINDDEELWNLFENIQTKVDEINTNVKYGIGVSYTEGYNDGQDNMISPSIDYASLSSSLARKANMDKWKWAMKVNVNEDDVDNVSKLEDIIIDWHDSDNAETKLSSSGKNRYFTII